MIRYLATPKKLRKRLAQGEVDTLPVSQVTLANLRGLNVLIVGSPTRSFRPTPAISKFLKRLPQNQLSGISVAAFEPSIGKQKLSLPLW
jgi:hypothetical protein